MGSHPAAGVKERRVAIQSGEPVIQGERLQPRQVGWGDGSLDEMCLSYVWVRYDRDAYLKALGR